MERLMDAYLPVLILGVIAVLFAGGTVVASLFFGTRKPTKSKESPYECGMPPVGDAHERFSAKFFLVAMIFVIFDIEIVFLYPWAVIYRELGLFGLGSMGLFLAILLLGLAYDWRTGILDWGPEVRKRQPLVRKELS
ncbi:MAG: NADH-quinone oxidoreductase subunit A [bacterium]